MELDYIIWGLGLIISIIVFVILKRQMVLARYRRVVKKYPTYVDVRMAYAEVLFKYNLELEAFEQYERVLELYPEFYKARLRLAELNMKLGKYKKAENQLKYILEKAGEDNKFFYLAQARYNKLKALMEDSTLDSNLTDHKKDV